MEMSVKAYLDAFLSEKYRTSHFTHPQPLGPQPDLTLIKLLALSPRKNYLTHQDFDPILNRLYVSVKSGERTIAPELLTAQSIAEHSNLRPLIVSVIPERLATMSFTPSTEIMIATAIFIIYKDRIYTAINFGATRDINLLLGIYHEFYKTGLSQGPSDLSGEICTINIPNTKLDLQFRRNGFETILRKSMHNA